MTAPTPLRISTITATAGVNSPVDLKKLFDEIPLGSAIVFAEYGRVKTERITRGRHPRQPPVDDDADAVADSGKEAPKARQKQVKKRFDNQTTLVVLAGDSKVNMKVFANGSLQMTGLKRIEDGVDAIAALVDELKTTHIAEDPSAVKAVNYKVRMINSDFKIGYSVRRDHLYSLMLKRNMRCSYEPTIYPGVKVDYYFRGAEGKNGGICECADRGMSMKCAHCHKITLVVFRSGSIIITGASSAAHLAEANLYLVKTLTEHRDELEHVEYQIGA